MDDLDVFNVRYGNIRYFKHCIKWGKKINWTLDKERWKNIYKGIILYNHKLKKDVEYLKENNILVHYVDFKNSPDLKYEIRVLCMEQVFDSWGTKPHKRIPEVILLTKDKIYATQGNYITCEKCKQIVIEERKNKNEMESKEISG